ncbi:DUF3967 domain-containing protein [Priestia aryabhattai]|uniref:DUF3967 domain-containing protein n=1 Tax=Priestia aryabhattai TaxID=412384 RepID=UPI003D2C763F
MSDAKLGQEPAYWTSEVAKKLEVSDSTLRKWCIQLEATGYKFVKDENDSRAFTKHDLNALQLFKQIVKVQRKTKEVASLEVVDRYGDRRPTLPMQSAQLAAETYQYKATIDAMARSIEEIKTQLYEQLEFNKELVERMDQQSMSHIREIQETRKQLAAAQEKKKWWEFWK